MWTRNKDIDVGLEVLRSILIRHGFRGRLPGYVIAEAIGCNKQTVHNVERKALKKLRYRLKQYKEL